jgi:hypothetical protein
MNDLELKSKLKSVRVPERPVDYWENFPSQVRVNLRRAPVAFALRKTFWPRLAWAGGFAFGCLFLCMTLAPVHFALKNEKVIRRELAELPNHLRVFMADEHGMHYLIADQQ